MGFTEIVIVQSYSIPHNKLRISPPLLELLKL